jgi:RHS repeat-associated protein
MTTSGATTMTYDVANRMIISATSTGSAHFSYDTRNRRVWQWNGAVDQNNNPVSYSIYYYGANGKRLVAYTVTLSQVLTNGHISGYTLNSSVVLQDTYFGRRRLAPMDRIGSAADVGAYPGQQSISFFPYGQDKGTAGANDNWKFATYWRDSATGLDYAMNRYYSSGLGRFLSADPYTASGGPAVPQSWNRYAYVQGDPINWIDPSGRDVIDPEQCFEAGIWDASIDCGDGDSFGFLGYSSPPPLSQNQIVSIFRSAVAAAATAWLLANESRTSANTSIPTYLKEKSECWFPDSGAGSVQSATYTLFVTYQILNQNGQPIDGSALSGVSITEGIYPLSGALSPGPPWRYGTKYGIQQDGTFTDLLSSGGLPSFPNYITAFQTFTAGGTIAGVSFFQPLLVIGFGPTTGVLQNAYGPNNVTINGMGLGTNPATECPKNQ